MSFAISAVRWKALPRYSWDCPSRKCMNCWKQSFLCRRCSTRSTALRTERRTQNMALFHFTADQIKRSEGQSVMDSAAYRSGEKLHSTYYGEDSDYTRKKVVICSEILLPPHAPREFADRETLWNAVEHAEHGKKSQLAYSFEISLQNEFSLEENIALARKFLLDNFVSRGMTVDVAFHEKETEEGGTPNPHFHFLCPIRPMNPDGTWGFKQHRVYRLDEDGNRIRDQNGKFLFDAVPTTDWGDPETLEQWRKRCF